MNRRYAAAVVMLLASTLVIAWLVVRGQRSTAVSAVFSRDEPPRVEARTQPEALPARQAKRRVTIEERRLLLEAIAAARQQRTHAERRGGPEPEAPAQVSPNGLPPGSHAVPESTHQYVCKQVKEVLPLLADCYETQVRSTPGVRGDLVVRFNVEGEPGVGGIVTQSAAVGGTLAQYPDLTECIEQTMTTVAFDPPEAGGIVKIDYPFVFEPSTLESSPAEPSRAAVEPPTSVPGFVSPQP